MKPQPLLYDLLLADCAAGKPFRLWLTGGSMNPHRPGFRMNLRADGTEVGNPTTLYEVLRGATVFVIEDDAIRTAMDLRSGLMTEGLDGHPRRKLSLPDLARVPFAATWLEYSPRAKVSEYDTELTSSKIGHLIMRETRAAMVFTFEQEPEDGAHPDAYHVMPYVMRWTDWDDLHSSETRTKYPGMVAELESWIWVHGDGAEGRRLLTPDGTGLFNRALLTGRDWLPVWAYRFGGEWHQPGKFDWAMAAAVLDKDRSSGSLLMMLLALVAWCPVDYRTVVSPGRRMVRRQNRRLAAHQTVSISIPVRRCFRYLKRAESGIHKRRHRVREHFRVLGSGVVVLVHEHERGDASLGWVDHDYAVSGGGGGGTPGV